MSRDLITVVIFVVFRYLAKMKGLVDKIVSGGQTGVDRAALDAAIFLCIEHGGWCPHGRLSEGGAIPVEYRLKETQSADYSERTKLNVRDSDGTLLLVPEGWQNLGDGTVLTVDELKKIKKPFKLINPFNRENFDDVVTWLYINQICTLNVAGPRESKSEGIYVAALEYLKEFFL